MKILRLLLLTSLCLPMGVSSAAELPLREQAIAGLKRAATFYRTKAASHGGYVYYYSPDFTQRWGEGSATADQIFVQPPGTPAVGMAFLTAHAATGDPFYLDAAREAAEALVHGQLESGGWAQVIDFDPRGSKAGQYRNGKGRGRNYSTLDDGISQSALRFLMHTDRALGFKHTAIHEAVEFGRKSLLAAQFPSGAFPQVWSGPVPAHPPAKASFPDYDWRTGNRIKNYWDLPTLNDDLCGYTAHTLQYAWEIYRDDRCRSALLKLGDFLIAAQMPDPQPAWAQQYDFQMRPVWARKFEPPAVSGRESQDAMEVLMRIYRLSGDAKYLAPIPRALDFLKRVRLPDGRLARYYELATSKPLYMTKDYQLTHDDSDAPEHYGWKTASHLDAIEAAFKVIHSGAAPSPAAGKSVSDDRVRRILLELDAEGRWVSTYVGERLVGQPKFASGAKYLASEVFIRNLEALSNFVALPTKK